jgi:hypothetical protein
METSHNASWSEEPYLGIFHKMLGGVLGIGKRPSLGPHPPPGRPIATEGQGQGQEPLDI